MKKIICLIMVCLFTWSVCPAMAGNIPQPGSDSSERKVTKPAKALKIFPKGTKFRQNTETGEIEYQLPKTKEWQSARDYLAQKRLEITMSPIKNKKGEVIAYDVFAVNLDTNDMVVIASNVRDRDISVWRFALITGGTIVLTTGVVWLAMAVIAAG